MKTARKKQSAAEVTDRDLAWWVLHPEFRAFGAAIRANPDDDLPRLAAADWLDDRGDRAAHDYAVFIRECVSRPDRLTTRASRLLEENYKAWLGPAFSTGEDARTERVKRLGPTVLLDLTHRHSDTWAEQARVRLRWVRGFVTRAEFGSSERNGRHRWPHRKFMDLAPRVAKACPAAATMPTRGTAHYWLSARIRAGGGGRPVIYDLTVGNGLDVLLPDDYPFGHVVVKDAQRLRPWKEYPELIREQITGPLTEYAHQRWASERGEIAILA